MHLKTDNARPLDRLVLLGAVDGDPSVELENDVLADRARFVIVPTVRL